MNCPTDNTLRAYLDHECEPLDPAELQAHLASCPACREEEPPWLALSHGHESRHR